ncbi:btk-binding protein-related [Anaeramoeba ignava]|uniref:Btk-binding protein-related n=1 Tax=Anaeramoeba ignava TaxID=1746090 RepID=A0A9Q0LRF7_ANAIG|nr:btk-binding protein-related [Anaeramoeba ignava]
MDLGKQFVFCWGYNKEKQLSPEEERTIQKPKPFAFLKDQEIDLIFASDIDTLCFCGERIYQFGKTGTDSFVVPNMQKIISGLYHFSILDENGEIYSWGKDYFREKIRPELLPFSKNHKAIDIEGGIYHTFILTTNRQLFLIKMDKEYFIASNVKRFFGGNHNNDIIYQKDNGKYYLKMKDIEDKKRQEVFTNFEERKNLTIEKMARSMSSNVLVTKKNSNGKTCVYQISTRAAAEVESAIYRKLTEFKGKSIKQIVCGYGHFMVLTEENQLYTWGENQDGQLGNSERRSVPNPTLLEFEEFTQNRHLDWRIHAGNNNSFLYVSSSNSFIKEIYLLFERQEVTDLEIKCLDGVWNAHLPLIQVRLSSIKNFDDFLFFCKRRTKNQVKFLLDFIYTGIFSNDQVLEQFLGEMKLDQDWILDKKFSQNVLVDIGKLYEDENGKDFTIVTKEMEIKAHKFILSARSELFRGMFLSVNDESNRVQDYSAKSPKAIQSIIQFFYLKTLDFSLTEQELEDVEFLVDYYQVCEQNIRPIIDKIRSQRK